MSTEPEQARLLAERIARRMSDGTRSDDVPVVRRESQVRVGDELAAVRATLEQLQKRLARIESSVTTGDTTTAARLEQVWDRPQEPRVSNPAPTAVRSPWLGGMYVSAAHPSQERFGVEEAAVSELVGFFEGEKTCEVEPGGKTCDHCAMCSSRGF